MGTGLHDWAKTGDYFEEPRPPRGRAFPGAWRLENAPVAALVPIGILMGSLLALAFIGRLLLLPLQKGAGSLSGAGE